MTPEIHSTDYHDFVFRNGKLVGEFDQMYRNSAEVPWHQDDAERRLDCRLAATILQHHGPFDSVLEAGAGLGFFADLLWRALNPRTMTGTDVSPEAVRRARARFPHIAFEEMDLMVPGADVGRRYDLVAIRGCFWYLFPKLDVVVANLTLLIARGGCAVRGAEFPAPRQAVRRQGRDPKPGRARRAVHARFRSCGEAVHRKPGPGQP